MPISLFYFKLLSQICSDENFIITKFLYACMYDAEVFLRIISRKQQSGDSCFFVLNFGPILQKKEQVKPYSCEKCEKLILLPSIFSFTAKINKRFITALWIKTKVMKTIWIILLSLCVGGLLSTMLMRSCQVEPPLPEMMVLRDTITEIYIDTHTVYKPVPYKVEIKDTVYLSNNESIESDCQNKHAQGTLFVQEVKEYKDSTYYAKISGINAYLEEIRVYPKTITQYVNTKEYIYVPPKKWSIGIQGGVGITPKGLQPYIGIGFTYDLIQ